MASKKTIKRISREKNVDMGVAEAMAKADERNNNNRYGSRDDSSSRNNSSSRSSRDSSRRSSRGSSRGSSSRSSRGSSRNSSSNRSSNRSSRNSSSNRSSNSSSSNRSSSRNNSSSYDRKDPVSVAKQQIKNAKKVWEKADADYKSGRISEKEAKWRKDRAHKSAEEARGYLGESDADYTLVDGHNDKIVTNKNDYDDKNTGEYDVEKREKGTNDKVSYDYRGEDDEGGIEEIYKKVADVDKKPENVVDSETDLLEGYNMENKSKGKSEDIINSETDLLKGYKVAGNKNVKNTEDMESERISGDEDKASEGENDFMSRANESYQQKDTRGMNDYDKQTIQEAGQRWEKADADYKAGKISKEEANKIKEEAHSEAEEIRNRLGFSGGEDGTQTQSIEVAGEGVYEGTAKMNPETGQMEFEGENSPIINELLNELEQSKSEQEFYQDAIKKISEQDSGFNEEDVLTYEEAVEQAENQVNPMYEKGREEYMEKMDKDAVKRGVFGQIPQEALKRHKASELEAQKASDVASLATELRGQSLQEARTTAQMKQQEMNQKLNVLMSGLQASGNSSKMAINTLNTVANIQSQREQLNMQKDSQEFQQGMAEEEMNMAKDNQDFNQKMALSQLNLEKEKFAQDKVYNNQKIAQTWERIKNSKLGLRQAQQRLGLNEREMDLTEDQFKLGLSDKAWEMTNKQIAESDDSIKFDANYYEGLKEKDTDYNEREGLMKGDDGYMNQASDYLEEIKNQSTEEYSESEIQDMYENNLNILNSQLNPLGEYQD
ncbi:MAG: hypothetical protein ACQEQF_00735 [Bacillota bacterium]